MVEERERPEPERLAAGLDESGTRQSFVDEAAGLQGPIRGPGTKPRLHQYLLHEQHERPQRRIEPGLEKIDHRRPIGGREDDMTTRPDHASHLPHRQFRSLEISYNT